MSWKHTNPLMLFAALSRFMCTLAAPLPLPAPQPAPLPPSVAQGLIAVLALGHAGIIGYAIHKESSDETLQFVGKDLHLNDQQWSNQALSSHDHLHQSSCTAYPLLTIQTPNPRPLSDS